VRQVLAAWWISFAFLAVGSSPAHFWLDSGELGAAGAELGVMHPPGIPGFALLLRASAVLPVGSLGFRMAVVSGLLGATAVALLFVILRRHGAQPAVAWGAALWVLLSWTFVRQARVLEIYTFGAVLLVTVLWGLDPACPEHERGRRRLLATFAAVWAAWCFGDLRLVLVPLVAVVWLVDARRGRPWIRWAPLVAAVASLSVLALPLASARAPMTDWGDADAWSRMWEQLNASSIRAAYAHEILPASAAMWMHNLEGAMDRLAEDLGPLGPAFGLVCLLLLLARRGSARVAGLALVWLAAVELFYVVGINPMGGADRQTGLPLVFVVTLAVGGQLTLWVSRLPRLRWALLPLLWMVLLLPTALTSAADLRGTRSWAPHAWTRAALAQLPPGALLLTQTDDLAAGVTSARVVEGARPDVVTAPAQHLYRPMPDRARHDTREHRVWAAAAGASTEATRIEAAIAAFPDAVAVEHPGAGLFRPVAWWSAFGRVPIGILGRGLSAETHPRASAEQEADEWLPRMPSAQDRVRLAVALGNQARARLRIEGAAAMPEAVATFETVLGSVEPDHPSTLVALAAVLAGHGQLGRAIALTRRALQIEPARNAALVNLALYLAEDPATRGEAEAVARRASDLRPWRADAWQVLGHVLEKAGDLEGARQARERASMTGDAR
jgi:hypothetical protein